MSVSSQPSPRSGSPRVAPPEGAPTDEEDLSYVTRPTRTTVFLRTFLPWQAWRFIRINLKMMRMIRHRS